MFFDDHVSRAVEGYGVGTTTENGRYHLLAFLGGTGGEVQMLCSSSPKIINGRLPLPRRRFEDEYSAVQQLRTQKNACQKCLRSIETAELNLAEQLAFL